MTQKNTRNDVGILEFQNTGLFLKAHLSQYLGLGVDDLERLLPRSKDSLANLHPGSFQFDDPTSFYEENVGTGHLLELAAWHLTSVDYISETLRLQEMFASGQVLDFGGGIGTHALVAAAMQDVDHVWFVDLNPDNRSFVEKRASLLGLSDKISFHRDLTSTDNVLFDTVICFDVLEHLPDPSSQLKIFLERMPKNGVTLLNWYFFKGNDGEYPFHFDDPKMIDDFFRTLQSNFLEIFHPLLITARAYKAISKK